MHDRRDGGYERGGFRHERDCDERHRGRRDRPCDCARGPRDRDGQGGDRPGRHGGGPDTRFLQLEMSQVLYGEAESVTKQAFRELLLEAAKERFRERFGDKIVGLAQLAVDELMNDVAASLEIEARIQERNQERDGTKDRLRDIFGERGQGSGGSGTGDDEDR